MSEPMRLYLFKGDSPNELTAEIWWKEGARFPYSVIYKNTETGAVIYVASFTMESEAMSHYAKTVYQKKESMQ